MLSKSHMLTALVFAGAAGGCAATRPLLGYDELWMPALDRIVPPGAMIDDVVLKTECAGIAEVRNVPDHWSMQGTPSGENFEFELAPHYPADYYAQLDAQAVAEWNRNVSLFRARTLLRGRWSDCAYWRLSVRARDLHVPERMFQYRFEPDLNSPTGDWRVIDATGTAP